MTEQLVGNKKYSTMWNFHQKENRNLFAGAGLRLKKIAKLIGRFSTAPSYRILDIGFGDGTLLEILYDKGYQCYGLDFAEENVNLTKKIFDDKRKKIQLMTSDIQNIPLSDKFIDVVVASEVIEHLDDETLKNGLKEICRILKPGGHIIITVPYEEDLTADLTACPHCGAVFHRWGHQQSYTKTKLESLLIAASFNNINIRGVNFKDANLNLFGKIDWILRLVFKKYKNYLAIASRYEPQ